MNIFLESIKSGNDLHHFYIIEGTPEVNAEKLVSFFEREFNISTSSSSLFFNINLDRLLIDDAKEIGRKAIIKTPTGEKMIFLVSCNSATNEAQNSLLKVVEEPPQETYFFFNVPRSEMFLPTVVSRAIVIKGLNERGGKLLKELQNMSLSERVKWSDDLAKDISNDKISRGEVQSMIDGLIAEIYVELPNHPAYAKTLKGLDKISKYVPLNGASMKILLNRVALAL
jgi:DNA polymerase III delta prime subunit